MPVISDLHQLERLVHVPPPLLPGRTIRLDIPALDQNAREEWEDRLSRLAGVCGCKSGAVSLSVFLVMSVGMMASGALALSLPTFGLIMVGSLVAAAMGKIVGIVVGKVRLRIAVTSLTRLIEGSGAVTQPMQHGT